MLEPDNANRAIDGDNMPEYLKIFPLLAALSLSGGAIAQDNGDQSAENSADPGLSMGEQAQMETYLRESSGDWQLECLRDASDEEPCQLFQEMKSPDGAPIATIRLFRLENAGEAEAGAVIAVPLETLLTAQLTMSVDGNAPRRYPFSLCDPLGCYARIGLRPEEITQFKRGAKAVISIVPFIAPDQRVNIDMSLNGFTAAYEKITAVQGK